LNVWDAPRLRTSSNWSSWISTKINQIQYECTSNDFVSQLCSVLNSKMSYN
jgi:hypothetical protein